MITLALDASTYTGSVAVFDGDQLLADRTATMRGRESERLMPTVDETLRSAGVIISDIERIACGAGPGSFTSLRIAASLAKGLASGRGLPLFAVSSLALIVAANASVSDAGQRYAARLSALRGESYVAEFARGGDGIREVRPMQLLADDGVADWAGGALVVGPDDPGQWMPHARGLGQLGAAVFDRPVNLAGWEPVYGRLAEAQAKWEATHGRALRS